MREKPRRSALRIDGNESPPRDPVTTSSIFSWPYNRRDRIIDPTGCVKKVSANNGPCLIKRSASCFPWRFVPRSACTARGEIIADSHAIAVTESRALGLGLLNWSPGLDKSRRRSRLSEIYLVEMIVLDARGLALTKLFVSYRLRFLDSRVCRRDKGQPCEDIASLSRREMMKYYAAARYTLWRWRRNHYNSATAFHELREWWSSLCRRYY